MPMLTRSQARATNQHVFVDDKWNDAYIQTKDEQIDMLHAQRVLKSWEDGEDSEAEAKDEEDDPDRWISEDSSDEDDNNEASKKPTHTTDAQRRRRSPSSSVLAGGGWAENVLWTTMAAAVAPVVLYAAAVRVGILGKRRENGSHHRRMSAWPLESASLTATLVKAYANVATIALLLSVGVWGVCGDIVLPLSRPYLHWRSLTRLARRVDTCATNFIDDWMDSVAPSKLPLLLLNRETQHLVAHAALLLVIVWLLTQFYRLWVKSVVLFTMLSVTIVRVASDLRAKQRTAIEITSLDPIFAFANESIFIAIDGQNLEQGAMVAWVPYWGVLQHLQAYECDKLFAQPLRNGGVRVAFDQLNEFVPCYAAHGEEDDFKCFEHLRLRVKDQRSVPGWSLHTRESRQSDEL